MISSVLKLLSNNVKVVYRALINADGDEISPATEDKQSEAIAAVVPPIPTPRASVTLADDDWNEAFTIPDNCVRAEVVFSKSAYCMAGVTTVNPAQDGAPYMPNIRYPIPTGGSNDRLFVKNETAGQNVTAEVTFYCSA